MKNVTQETSNPFGMRPPFERGDAGCVQAVFGYGDANADFHVIGDHPGVHGGAHSGIPFTETDTGEALQSVLRAVGFIEGPPDAPTLENCFLDYIHMCTLPGERVPTQEEYADLERFFDAELRAINAHILLPVGPTATEHVLREYTTQRRRFGPELDMATLHASQIRGRGFLVVPIQEPTAWKDGNRDRLIETLEAILASDYRQTKGVATTVG